MSHDQIADRWLIFSKSFSCTAASGSHTLGGGGECGNSCSQEWRELITWRGGTKLFFGFEINDFGHFFCLKCSGGSRYFRGATTEILFVRDKNRTWSWSFCFLLFYGAGKNFVQFCRISPPLPPPPLLMYLSTSPLGGKVGASQQLVIDSGEEPSGPLPKCFSSPKWQYLCLFYGKYFEIFKNIAMFHLRTRKHSGGHSWVTNWQVVRDILYPYLARAPLFGQASRYITTGCRKFIQIRGCSVIPFVRCEIVLLVAFSRLS